MRPPLFLSLLAPLLLPSPALTAHTSPHELIFMPQGLSYIHGTAFPFSPPMHASALHWSHRDEAMVVEVMNGELGINLAAHVSYRRMRLVGGGGKTRAVI